MQAKIRLISFIVDIFRYFSKKLEMFDPNLRNK
jgi:hypothetical protein